MYSCLTARGGKVVDWIELADDGYEWWVDANALIKYRLAQSEGISWLFDELAGVEEALCSVDLVVY
jgi:hypothetical protein